MKIAVLSGSISNDFALAILLKLKTQHHHASIVIKRKFTIKNIKAKIAKDGLKEPFIKKLNKFILKRNSENNIQYSYLKNYLKDLGYPQVGLKEIIEKDNIPFIYVRDIMDDKCLSFLHSIKPDILIQAGVGIIREGLLNIPNIGVLNAHMGLLPKYRGMNVLEWSLFYNDPIGITIHFIDKGIDTGDILLRKNIPIEKGDTIASLREKSGPISVEALVEAVDKLEKDVIQPIKQRQEDGRQYFVMHKRLKDLVDNKLQKVND